MRSKVVFFLLIFLCFFSPSLFASEIIPHQFQVIKEDQTGIHLRVIFDDKIVSNPQNLNRLFQHTFLVWQDSVYSNPLLTKSFIPLTQNVSIQLIKTEFQTVRFEDLTIPIEAVLDTTNRSPESGFRTSEPGTWKLATGDLVKIKIGNSVNGVKIYNVQFFPLQPGEQENQIKFYDQIEIKLNFDYSSALGKFNNSIISPETEKYLKQNIINYSTWQSFRQQSTPVLLKPNIQQPYDVTQTCNIVVSKEGWYRIFYHELKEAGVPVDFIDAKKLQLFHKGKEIPLYFPGDFDRRFNPGETIEFWGELNKNTDFPDAEDIFYDPYSLRNVYVLAWNQKIGLRYSSQNSMSSTGRLPPKLPFYFERNIHVEEDRSYNRLGWAPAGSVRDHWFQSQVGSGEIQNFPIDLPVSYPYALEPIKMKLWFHGITLNSHKVEVYLNQNYIGSGEWFGADKYLLDIEISDVGGAILDQEKHTLTIINRSPDELDFVLYNWLEIEYPQAFEAKNNFLVFTRPQNEPTNFFQFRLKEFTKPEIEIFKINNYRMYNADILESLDSLNNATYQVRFQDESYSTNDRYVALTPEQKLTPDTLFVYRAEENFTTVDNQADYLIITHPKFLENPKLDEFVAFREEKYHVKVVSINDINQQFNFGNTGPVGVKNFILHTQKYWTKPAPSYVLLIGDGNYNYRSPVSQLENYVPTFHYQTYKFGAAVSDTWYITDKNDYLLPGLHIGRWPINEVEELAILIDKTIAYEQPATVPDWQNKILMIATDMVFRQQTSEILNQIVPPSFFIDQLHTFPISDPFFGDTERLIETWNEGAVFVNFRGHGGGAVWADNLLFRFEDVERLNNQSRLPFVTSMTCFTCAFDGGSNLGESLLLYENGGVIGMLGSAGVGWVWNDYYLLRELMTEIFAEPNATLGSIVTNAKMSYGKKYFTPQRNSDIHQYNLLGDPAVTLKLPWQKIEMTAPNQNYSPGDLVNVSTNLLISEGIVQIKVQKKDGNWISESQENITSSNQSFQINLPNGIVPGEYLIKMFGYNSDQTWLGHGSLAISVDGISVHKIKIEPASPTAQDSIRIFATCLGFPQADSNQVFFVFRKSEIDSIKMQPTEKADIYQAILPPGFTDVGEHISFYVSILSGSQYIKSNNQTLRISQHPNFQIAANTLKLENQNEELNLSVQIRNRSDFIMDSLLVEFWVSGLDSNFSFLGNDIIKLESYQQNQARVTWPYKMGNYLVQVKVDPNQVFQETNYDDNMIVEEFFSNQMQISEAILQNSSLNISFPFLDFNLNLSPEIAQKVLKFRFNSSIETPQDQLEIYGAKNWTSPVFYLGFLDEAENHSVSAQFDLILDSLDLTNISADSMLAFYQYYSNENRWAKVINQNLIENVYRCSVQKLGYFAWFRSEDLKPPQIKILTQNRGFYDGGFVQKNPSFTIRLDDSNGAHPNPDLLLAEINGQPILSQDFEIKNNYQNGSQLLQLDLNGVTGENSLKVAGFDCSGNLSQPLEIKFKVNSDLDILPLGNYPNPFVDLTVFAYELTTNIEDFSLKIYTSSGKLIKTFNETDIIDDPNPREVGYHEITWEGLDDDGEEVANGVYFYQYQIKGNGKVLKKNGKIARLQ